MIGVLDDITKHIRSCFIAPLDAIVLLGRNTNELGGSEYLKVVHGKVMGDAPAVDLQMERGLQDAMLEIANERLAHSAHDCAEGGLAVCVAESSIGNPERLMGAHLILDDPLSPAALLFGEAQGRIVISSAPGNVERVKTIAARHGVPATVIGNVGEVNGRFVIAAGHVRIDVPVAELSDVWRDAIPRLMESKRTQS
jgi:phosphoribosylformylglycinamidine synthase